jgi:hypothetical protein
MRDGSQIKEVERNKEQDWVGCRAIESSGSGLHTFSNMFFLHLN